MNSEIPHTLNKITSFIQNIRSGSNYNKWIAFSVLFILILFSVVLIFVGRNSAETKNKITPLPTQTIQNNQTLQNPPALKPAPNVYFEKYDNKAGLPKVPSNIFSYTFKTNFSLSEILSFGNKFGLTGFKNGEGNNVILFNNIDLTKTGVLAFNKTTGTFFFQSFDNANPSVNTQLSKGLAVQNFLGSIGAVDQIVTCPITYQKKEFPDVFFVECHRDWSLTGLPILNFEGILNIAESRPLASLRVGTVNEFTAADTSIVNTSTGEDGKARPNDFNTITVALDNNGHILSIASNLRKITKVSTLAPNSVLSPNEALDKFYSHKAQLSLTLPGGSGTVDFDKVYPKNLAYGKIATITDYILAYIEKPPYLAQENLVPMYIIRGTTLLSSGYTVRFTQTVPALSSGLSFLERSEIGIVAGDSTIKLGSFIPGSDTPTPIPSNVTSVPLSISPTVSNPNILSPTSGPSGHQSNLNCHPSENDLNPVYDLGGDLGKVGVYQLSPPTKFYLLYYIPPTDAPLPSVDAVIEEVKKISPAVNNVQIVGPKEQLLLAWQNYNGCPFNISTGSPTLFVYAPLNTKVMIKSGADLIYSDPPISLNKNWDTKILEANKLEINNVGRDFIYYEYNPVSFKRPNSGWIISKEKLENFVENLSSKMKLTGMEKERSLFEIRSAANKIRSANIFIGLIPQSEVDTKLSLTVNPTPELILRYHFYLAATNTQSVTEPKISPISRKGFMILEFGAVIGN